MVAAALGAVFVHPDPAELSAAWDRVPDTFGSQFPKLTELMQSAKARHLDFSAFPSSTGRCSSVGSSSQAFV